MTSQFHNHYFARFLLKACTFYGNQMSYKPFSHAKKDDLKKGCFSLVRFFLSPSPAVSRRFVCVCVCICDHFNCVGKILWRTYNFDFVLRRKHCFHNLHNIYPCYYPIHSLHIHMTEVGKENRTNPTREYLYIDLQSTEKIPKACESLEDKIWIT